MQTETDTESLQLGQSDRAEQPAAPRIISNWDISRHLPSAAQEHFEVIIGSFVLRPVQWPVGTL